MTIMLIMSLFIAPSITLADGAISVLETDWLGTEIGSTGNVLGAKVVDIKNSPGTETTVINIEIPVNNPDDFETIEVIGKNTLQPIKQKRKAEWIENHEEGVYGLRLYLKRAPGFEFQLRLIDNENDKKY